MASETHVWLLHAGRPERPEGRAEWVRRAWQDPRWNPGLSGLWRGIWAWWQGRKAAPPKALAGPVAGALTGPIASSGQLDPELELVDELQRHLGPGVSVRLVPHWPEDALVSAARSLTMGVRVVLLPLCTLPDGARSPALLAAAEAQLDRRRKVARAPVLTAEDGVVDVLSSMLRAGLIDLAAPGPVPVLFLARAAAAPGKDAAYQAQAERLAQAVATAARLAGPAELAFYEHAAPWGGPEPRAAKVLAEWAQEGHKQALVLGLDALVEAPDTSEAMDALVCKAPLKVIRAPLPGGRPLFVHCLGAAKAAAETRAGWDTE